MQDFIAVNGFEIKRINDNTYLVDNILTLNTDEKRIIISMEAKTEESKKIYLNCKEELQRYIQQYDFFVELQK